MHQTFATVLPIAYTLYASGFWWHMADFAVAFRAVF